MLSGIDGVTLSNRMLLRILSGTRGSYLENERGYILKRNLWLAARQARRSSSEERLLLVT
jgi:hypothetical protein